PVRTVVLGVGVQAMPIRGAKFVLSSWMRRSPILPSRTTQMAGSNRVETPWYGAPFPMRTKQGWAFGSVPKPLGSQIFISSPCVSSHGGVYSYRSPRSNERFDLNRQASWKKYA